MMKAIIIKDVIQNASELRKAGYVKEDLLPQLQSAFPSVEMA